MTDVSNVFWWRPSRRFRLFPRPLNLGDALSPYIVRQVLESMWEASHAPSPQRRVLAIGSILNHARDHDIVWGSGYNGIKNADSYSFRALDVRAVRGPLTAQLIRARNIDVPEIYGDPGILVSLFYKPKVHDGVRKPLVIPHYNAGRLRFPGFDVAYTRGSSIEDFVTALAGASIVFSASLHGLVLAEAYGVPAVFMNVAMSESIQKYRDYYEGTGRSQFPVARSLEEAIVTEPAPLPDVASIQRRLLEAFPIDAWR